MTRFREAVRAELLKVTTTKVWWILALIMVAYLGFTALSLGATFALVSNQVGAGMSDDGSIAIMTYTVASTMGFFFPVLLGALSVTGEYRHRTIIPTFLTVANRKMALAAKLTVQFLFGLLFGAIAFTTTIVASIFFFTGAGLDSGLGDLGNWGIILRSILVMAVWAMIGVGIGTLIPNQAAVLVIVIGFTQFIEPILRLVASLNDTFANVGKFLPGAVSDGFGGASFYSLMTGVDAGGQLGGTSTTLVWWAAGLMLLGYAALAIGSGYLARWRRDVG